MFIVYCSLSISCIVQFLLLEGYRRVQDHKNTELAVRKEYQDIHRNERTLYFDNKLLLDIRRETGVRLFLYNHCIRKFLCSHIRCNEVHTLNQSFSFSLIN